MAPRFELLCVLVGLLAVIPFMPALGGPFFWDDTRLILNNPYVHSLSFVWRWFTHAYFDTGQPAAHGTATYYRPLSLASFAFDWFWGGGNPTAFHATNLTLHLATTLAIVTALARWTSNRVGALLASLLLAWHPTRAESIAWISGRTDVLVTLFILLACQGRALYRTHRKLSVTLESLATFLAYASKETAIVLPVFVALETWVLLERPALTLPNARKILRGSSVQISAALAYILVRSYWLRPTGLVHADIATFGFRSHVGLVLQTLGRAMGLALLPLTQRGQHGLVSLDTQGKLQVDAPYALIGVIALLLSLALIVWSRLRRPLVAWGGIVFFVCWFPTSQILRTHLACDLFERFLFLPLLGLALIVLGAFADRKLPRQAITLTAVMLVPAFGFGAVRSFERSRDYSDPYRFWVHESKVNPLSSEAAIGLLSARKSVLPIDRALSLLERCHRNAMTRGQVNDAVRCTFDAAVLIADYSFDLDERTVASSVDFFQTVVEQLPGEAKLDSPWGMLSLNLANSFDRELIESRSGEALSVMASLASRARDPKGIGFARRAIARCPTCRYVPRLAKALASFGYTEEALRILEPLAKTSSATNAAMTRLQIQNAADWQHAALQTAGPQKIHAEAQAYLSLGYFGAAYSMLNPHQKEFENLPALATDYARIALNAGNSPEARRTLARLLPPNEVERQIEDWQNQRNLISP